MSANKDFNKLLKEMNDSSHAFLEKGNEMIEEYRKTREACKMRGIEIPESTTESIYILRNQVGSLTSDIRLLIDRLKEIEKKQNPPKTT